MLNGINIADIHMGKKDDIKLFKELTQVFFPVIEEEGDKTDLVTISGDLFDRVLKLNEIGSILAIRFVNQLADYALKYNFAIRIIKGTKTHDFNQLNNFRYLENNPLLDIEIIETLAEEDFTVNGKTYDILYIPEEYVDDTVEYYADAFSKKYDLIFFHGMFDFVAIPHIDSERHVKNAPTFKAADFMDYAYGPVIGGHIHKHMIYKDKIFYSNSFSRFAYGEEDAKGFLKYWYDQNTGEYDVTFIENKLAPKYVTFNISLLTGETMEDKLQLLNKMKKENENTRIFAENVTDEDVMILKRVISDDASVKLSVKRQDIEEKIDAQYMFIINKEFDLETTLQKYIELENNVKIDLKVIKQFITSDS